MLTDRDERALLAAAENRVSRPLRIGAALASVRRAFVRLASVRLASVRRAVVRRVCAPRPRDQDRARERESVACHPTRTPIRP
ncbi:hypothetical protein ACFWG0_15180 [Streptomyces yangpuensis]|uniref:hypothetical protein n=1 Tax=Streptomyces yangpuensis TaxID=1648182 RepID=UPI00365D7D1B